MKRLIACGITIVVMCPSLFAQYRSTYDHNITYKDMSNPYGDTVDTLKWMSEQQRAKKEHQQQMQLQREALDLQREQFNKQLEYERERNAQLRREQYEQSQRTPAVYSSSSQPQATSYSQPVSHRQHQSGERDNDPLGIRNVYPKHSERQEALVNRVIEENALLKQELQEIKQLLLNQQNRSISPGSKSENNPNSSTIDHDPLGIRNVD